MPNITPAVLLNISHLGAVKNSTVRLQIDVVRWMRAADVLAGTSLEERNSPVSLEAMQTRAPVIAFAGTGGPDELLVSGLGVLLRQRSSAALAAAVHYRHSVFSDLLCMLEHAHSRVKVQKVWKQYTLGSCYSRCVCAW
jgi:glycosyltransferase involved in cell wall biosynthesis